VHTAVGFVQVQFVLGLVLLLRGFGQQAVAVPGEVGDGIGRGMLGFAVCRGRDVFPLGDPAPERVVGVGGEVAGCVGDGYRITRPSAWRCSMS